jgi:parallel beta-helix repeat protein
MSTYYVATNGSNTNSGSITSPFQTIAKGTSVLVAGDTLYIRSGSYSESINSGSQTIPAGTSWANAPLISAYPSETVTLRGIGLFSNSLQYLIFQNLHLNAQQTTEETIYIHTVHHIRVTGCEITGASRQGVLMPHQGDGYNEFINCNIHHNGTQGGQDHGIYVSSTNNLIDGCLVHDNVAYGIHTWNGYSGENANNNVYRNNRVYANGTGYPASYTAGIILSSGSGTIAYNNIVYGNMRGILVYGNTAGGKLYNNTIYNNTYQGIIIQSGASSTLVRNNISYLNSTPIDNQSSTTTLSNNLTTNPLFVNP